MNMHAQVPSGFVVRKHGVVLTSLIKGQSRIHGRCSQTPQSAPRAEYAAEFLSGRKSAGKYAARRISRRISFAVNPPKNKRAAVMFKPNS
jgi:hypothetical protein